MRAGLSEIHVHFKFYDYDKFSVFQLKEIKDRVHTFTWAGKMAKQIKAFATNLVTLVLAL